MKPGKWIWMVALLTAGCQEIRWEEEHLSFVGRGANGGMVLVCVDRATQTVRDITSDYDITQPGVAIIGLYHLHTRVFTMNPPATRGEQIYEEHCSAEFGPDSPCGVDPGWALMIYDHVFFTGRKLFFTRGDRSETQVVDLVEGTTFSQPIAVTSYHERGISSTYITEHGDGRLVIVMHGDTLISSYPPWLPADWSVSGDTLCLGNMLLALSSGVPETLRSYPTGWTCLSWGPGPDSLTFQVPADAGSMLVITDLYGNPGDTLSMDAGIWTREGAFWLVNRLSGEAVVYDRQGRIYARGGDLCSAQANQGAKP